MSMDLDSRIDIAKEALQKMRYELKDRQDILKKTIDILQKKYQELTERIGVVSRSGLDLSVYASIMEKVVADANPPHSLRLGHQVLLLMTIHIMETHEHLLRTICSQNKKLVKAVERRKLRLREQNSEHEIQFMNKLSTQYEGMRELDDEYRKAIHAQGVAISRLKWKSSIPEFPMPAITVTTSEYLLEQQSSIHHSYPTDRKARNAAAEFASSIRDLMVFDDTFHPPADDELMPTFYTESDTDATFDPDAEEHPSDFIVSLEMPLRMESDRGSNRRRGMRRNASFDSTDSMSTAGEELLQGIQSFFRGNRNSESEGSLVDADDLSIGY